MPLVATSLSASRRFSTRSRGSQPSAAARDRTSARRSATVSRTGTAMTGIPVTGYGGSGSSLSNRSGAS
jgi:hypothetical protein